MTSPRERDGMPRGGESGFRDIYADYAAGRLDPAFALLLETQSMLRPEVRRALGLSETLAGIMLEREAPARMAAGAAARALAAIDALEAGEGDTPHQSQREDPDLAGLPEPVRQPAQKAFGAKGWQPAAPGIRRLCLDVPSEFDVELYQIQPGAKVPRHSHVGQEVTLVVAGGFSDESGSFGPGDLAVKGPEDTHQPVGDPDGVCYALAVRDAGLRFTGMLGLIQRLLGQ